VRHSLKEKRLFSPHPFSEISTSLGYIKKGDISAGDRFYSKGISVCKYQKKKKNLRS
jgi:hypothetical protein